MLIFQAIVLVLSAYSLLVMIVNILSIRQLETYPLLSLKFSPSPGETYPRVSVLIPVRNEEANIERCVRTLLRQDYPNFEVVVLDDDSTDQTPQILERLVTQDERVRVKRGKPLPSGWMGKHWACQQLSQAAEGELLLFVDADTWFHPQALSSAVSALLVEQADFLAILPRHVLLSWAERLAVPLIAFAPLAAFPYPLATRTRTALLTITTGQCLLLQRNLLDTIGGFEAIRRGAMDVLVNRRVRAFGLHWRLANGTQGVFCRLYQNPTEVWQGLSKGLFAGFDYNLALFLLFGLYLGLVYWEPMVVILAALAGYSISTPVFMLAALSAGLVFGLRLISMGWLRLPLYLAFDPVSLSVFMAMAIGVRSIYTAYFGGATWKGRPYPRRNESP